MFLWSYYVVTSEVLVAMITYVARNLRVCATCKTRCAIWLGSGAEIRTRFRSEICKLRMSDFDIAPIDKPRARVREYVFYVFSDFKRTWLFTFFWNDVSKSRKKSLAKVLVLNLNEFTYFASVIHSEPLLNIEWERCQILTAVKRNNKH